MKTVIVDFRISIKEKETLKNLGYNVILCPKSKNIYREVCGHPDMQIHIVNNHNIIVQREMDIEFIKALESLGYKISLSLRSLKIAYPLDIILNGISTEKFFIHNLKYTDPNLKHLVMDKELINVSQGYTKCSTAVISENAVITSDKGIAKELNKKNIDVLLVPFGDILLPNFDYGFIGGTCGLLENNVMGFFGSLEKYLYGKEVMEFLSKYKVEPVFLSDNKLTDRGSIFRLL